MSALLPTDQFWVRFKTTHPGKALAEVWRLNALCGVSAQSLTVQSATKGVSIVEFLADCPEEQQPAYKRAIRQLQHRRYDKRVRPNDFVRFAAIRVEGVDDVGAFDSTLMLLIEAGFDIRDLQVRVTTDHSDRSGLEADDDSCRIVARKTFVADGVLSYDANDIIWVCARLERLEMTPFIAGVKIAIKIV